MPIMDEKNKKYFEFMEKCRQLSDNTESAYFEITQSTYFDCVTDFHKNQDLKELTTAAKSAYNSVFKTTTTPGSVYLKAKDPTYDFNEIELLISLNDINKEEINEKEGKNIFTPFYKIIFDTSRLEYYLEFKLYTSDLHTYLMKICVELLDIDKIIELLKSINKILNYKLNILLGIDYLTCLDIKLKNILISYNEHFDIEEIVLHDFDMIACCSRKTNTTSCYKYSNTNTYMLIYYKLILFFQSYKIIKPILDIKSLFQDELIDISDTDLVDFFKNFINAKAYKLEKHYDIPNLPIEEKIHLFFYHYILNLIINSKPSILREDSNSNRILSKILPNRFKDMILNILKGNPTEEEYVHKLPSIFKGIFKGEIILYEKN